MLLPSQSQNQIKIDEIFWSDVLDSPVHHHHQNTNWGNIYWKNGAVVQFYRDVESMPKVKLFWCTTLWHLWVRKMSFINYCAENFGHWWDQEDSNPNTNNIQQTNAQQKEL